VPVSALLPYLIITFGLTWGLAALYLFDNEPMVALFGALGTSHPLFMLAVYAPAIAALIVVGYFGGPQGLRRFLGRLLLWRCPPGWVAFLLFGVPLIYYAGAAVKGNLIPGPPGFTSVRELLSAMAFMVLLGPVEELGWRGVALPLLQRRLAPVWAGLVLGAIWGLWHLPAFLLRGTPQSAWDFTPFLVGSVAVSVILTPLFNRTHGSILLAALFHFQLNNPLWPDAQPYDTIFFVAAAVLAVWMHRASMLARDGAVTEVVPGSPSS
jgi:membrane protease YdiL (CAAX protease family)